MVAIRELQHYLYCPHRWALLYNDSLWRENSYTVLAEIIHGNVHSGKTSLLRGNLMMRAVSIFSETYGIYGKTDGLELKKDKNGVLIDGYDGLYSLTLVEYKPTEPKKHPHIAERLQLYAQKVCVDEIFSTNSNACFYYADTKKRVFVEFDEEKKLLPQIISEINNARNCGKTPLAEYGLKCNGCSLRDICMPDCKTVNVKKIIKESLL